MDKNDAELCWTPSASFAWALSGVAVVEGSSNNLVDVDSCINRVEGYEPTASRKLGVFCLEGTGSADVAINFAPGASEEIVLRYTTSSDYSTRGADFSVNVWSESSAKYRSPCGAGVQQQASRDPAAPMMRQPENTSCLTTHQSIMWYSNQRRRFLHRFRP